MFVLKIVGILFALWASLKLMHFFDAYCEEKYDYHFFTFISFVTVSASVTFIIFGSRWYAGSSQVGGDMLNGIVLALIGMGLSAYQIKCNYKKTDLLYGIVGSVLQIPVFGVLSYLVISELVVVALQAPVVRKLLEKIIAM